MVAQAVPSVEWGAQAVRGATLEECVEQQVVALRCEAVRPR